MQIMKKIFLGWVLILTGFMANAQEPLTLDSCYAIAKRQYPMIQQMALIEKSKDYNVANAGKGYLPQFSINGQATYQSAVTSIPLTGLPPQFGELNIPTPSKDQYNIHGEVDQVIYDGGTTKDEKNIQRTAADVQEQNLDVQLYTIRDRVNQIYFGTLLIDEQIKENDLLQKTIQNSIDRIKAGVASGTALQSDADELEAELLQQQQNNVQLQASRKAYIDMLGLFLNKPLDANTKLEKPATVSITDSIKRPELAFYDSQKKNYEAQNSMLTAGNMPRLSFFFQGGYAKPGLDAFDTKFEAYYIGGFRFSWNFGGLYTLKNSRQLLALQSQTSDVEKETFLFNTRLSLKQQSSDILKLQQMISLDKEIIDKRHAVTEASKAKLDNGTFTVHDYINELNSEDQAKQNLLLHQVQLLMTEYEYQNTSGN